MKSQLFSLAVLVAFCIGAAAQDCDISKAPAFKKSPVPVLSYTDGARKAPARAASLEDNDIWGYYTGDNIEELFAIGIGQKIQYTYSVCYYVPGSLLQGCSINGINLPVRSTTKMKDLSVWFSGDGDKMEATQPIDISTLTNEAFNAIPLEKPYVVPDTGVYVGVTFTITKGGETSGDLYPIVCGGTGQKESFYLKEDTKWVDYSSDFGSFAMQLFFTGELPAGYASLVEVANYAASTPDEEISVPVLIYSSGSEAVNSLDYTVIAAGSEQKGRLEFETPIPAGLGNAAIDTIKYKAPHEYGDYAIKINIDKVNETDNVLIGDTLELSGRVLLEIVPRKTVVEEFTGTTCGYCPRGWAGMEMLKENRENFIGIAFHKYDRMDPMYVANYYSTKELGISGAPGCSVDRKALGVDPYHGSNYNNILGIADLFDYCNAIAPEVAVNVSGEFNVEEKTVDAKAEIKYLANNDKTYSIAYVLTADDLTGTTTYWKQSNYFSSDDPDGIDNEEYLSQFYKGGKYGTNPAEGVVYGDVMIGSSYSTGGVNLAPALTGEPQIGAKDGTEYSVSLPKSSGLLGAINWDKVYVVALVVANDGTIENAAKAQVTNWEKAEEALGIEGVQASAANGTEIARYNVSGQRIAAPQKGLNIVKYSDGRTVKVIVK